LAKPISCAPGFATATAERVVAGLRKIEVRDGADHGRGAEGAGEGEGMKKNATRGTPNVKWIY
jgi:hypothetical protein